MSRKRIAIILVIACIAVVAYASWQGDLLKAGIFSDGKNITIAGDLTVTGNIVGTGTKPWDASIRTNTIKFANSQSATTKMVLTSSSSADTLYLNPFTTGKRYICADGFITRTPAGTVSGTVEYTTNGFKFTGATGAVAGGVSPVTGLGATNTSADLHTTGTIYAKHLLLTGDLATSGSLNITGDITTRNLLTAAAALIEGNMIIFGDFISYGSGFASTKFSAPYFRATSPSVGISSVGDMHTSNTVTADRIHVGALYGGAGGTGSGTIHATAIALGGEYVGLTEGSITATGPISSGSYVQASGDVATSSSLLGAGLKVGGTNATEFEFLAAGTYTVDSGTTGTAVTVKSNIGTSTKIMVCPSVNPGSATYWYATPTTNGFIGKVNQDPTKSITFMYFIAK